MSGITFEFSDIEEKHIYSPTECDAENILKWSHVREFYADTAGKKLCTILRKNASNKYIHPEFNQGLISAIFNAYINHTALKMRPDDIWISILQSFSCYVNTHSEMVRRVFVNHDGKKNIAIPIHTMPHNDDMWDNLFEQFTTEIQKDVNKGILKWMTPEFTTTTSNDKIISQISIMDSMKSYFEYGAIMGCGIPRVTLCGNKDDWLKLCDKISGLKEFGIPILTEWSDVLMYVVKDMMKPFDGVIDKSFWDRICKYKDGRFAYNTTPPEYRGWFMAFNPFASSGNYLLNPAQQIFDTNEFGVVDRFSGYNSVVTIEVTGCTTFRQLIVYSGMLSMSYDSETNTLSPSPEWIVVGK